MGKDVFEQYDELVQGYKTGTPSEELLAQLFKISVQALNSLDISDLDLETSVLMCEILHDCVRSLKSKCAKYDFSWLTSQDLIEIYRNLGSSQSEMKDAIVIVLRYRLDREKCGTGLPTV